MIIHITADEEAQGKKPWKSICCVGLAASLGMSARHEFQTRIEILNTLACPLHPEATAHTISTTKAQFQNFACLSPFTPSSLVVHIVFVRKGNS